MSAEDRFLSIADESAFREVLGEYRNDTETLAYTSVLRECLGLHRASVMQYESPNPNSVDQSDEGLTGHASSGAVDSSLPRRDAASPVPFPISAPETPRRKTVERGPIDFGSPLRTPKPTPSGYSTPRRKNTSPTQSHEKSPGLSPCGPPRVSRLLRTPVRPSSMMNLGTSPHPQLTSPTTSREGSCGQWSLKSFRPPSGLRPSRILFAEGLNDDLAGSALAWGKGTPFIAALGDVAYMSAGNSEEPLALLEAHSRVTAVCSSDDFDECRVAIGLSNGMTHIYEFEGSNSTKTQAGGVHFLYTGLDHLTAVSAVCVSNEVFASGSCDGVISFTIWTEQSSHVLFRHSWEDEVIFAIKATRDAHHFCVAFRERLLVFHRTNFARPTEIVRSISSPPRAFSWFPHCDVSTICVGAEGCLRLLSLQNSIDTALSTNLETTGLAVSHSTSQVVVAFGESFRKCEDPVPAIHDGSTKFSPNSIWIFTIAASFGTNKFAFVPFLRLERTSIGPLLHIVWSGQEVDTIIAGAALGGESSISVWNLQECTAVVYPNPPCIVPVEPSDDQSSDVKELEGVGVVVSLR